MCLQLKVKWNRSRFSPNKNSSSALLHPSPPDYVALWPSKGNHFVKHFELFPTAPVPWSIWMILPCIAFLASDLSLNLTLIFSNCLVFQVLMLLTIERSLSSSRARVFSSPHLLISPGVSPNIPAPLFLMGTSITHLEIF